MRKIKLFFSFQRKVSFLPILVNMTSVNKQCYNCHKVNHTSSTCTLKHVCFKGCDPLDSRSSSITFKYTTSCLNNRRSNNGSCPRNPKIGKKDKITTINNMPDTSVFHRKLFTANTKEISRDKNHHICNFGV